MHAGVIPMLTAGLLKRAINPNAIDPNIPAVTPFPKVEVFFNFETI